MNRDEFIGKLRSIYVGEENAIDEIISEYDIQKRTIQYSSECINEKDGLIIAYRKEIDRLNNIINELEKYLKENIKLTKTAVHFEILDDYDTRKYKRDIALFEMVLDKLKALKEDNNGNN